MSFGDFLLILRFVNSFEEFDNSDFSVVDSFFQSVDDSNVFSDNLLSVTSHNSSDGFSGNVKFDVDSFNFMYKVSGDLSDLLGSTLSVSTFSPLMFHKSDMDKNLFGFSDFNFDVFDRFLSVDGFLSGSDLFMFFQGGDFLVKDGFDLFDNSLGDLLVSFLSLFETLFKCFLIFLMVFLAFLMNFL